MIKMTTVNTPEFFNVMNSISKEFDTIGIPHTMRERLDGYQIVFPWTEGDIAIHLGTYSCEEGCVESYQFSWDDGGVSVLDPEEAIYKIEEEYSKWQQYAKG